MTQTKKFFFSLLLLFLVISCLEGASFLSLTLRQGRIPSHEQLLTQMRRVVESEGRYDVDGTATSPRHDKNALHPYLGFVKDAPTGSRSLGFNNHFNILEPRTPDEIVIAVTGGSVASQVYVHGKDVIKERLLQAPAFRNKKIRFWRFALGGYKQPQQLMGLNYFLSLGAQPDIVINIDGFNEICLPVIENLQTGVFPYFPRAWNLLLNEQMDPRLMELAYQSVRSRHARVRLAERASSGALLRSSWFAHFLWTLGDRFLWEKIVYNNERLLAAKPDHLPYAMSGPAFDKKPKSVVFQEIASLWARASRFMNALAREQDLAYYHFLQPNQYVPGSKALSEEEKRRYYLPESALAMTAAQGYPYLKREGELLKRDGVSFVDATGIFSDVSETVYRDSCCHLNNEGVRIFAVLIADTIIDNAENAQKGKSF